MKYWILSLLLVVVMLLVAVHTHHQSVIFPEASAIAVGHWVFQLPVWRKKPWHIPVLPTLGAVVGIVVNHLNVALTIKECLSMSVILVILYVFKSRVSPAISAGILPIVLGLHSWWYVVSVAALTFCIMSTTLRKPKEDLPRPAQLSATRRVLFAAVAMAWIFIWNELGYSAYIIPPLLVAIYESFHEPELLHRTILKRSMSLTIAALSGTLLFFVIPHHVILLGAMAIAATMVITIVFKVRLIPAFALSLLPIVLHVHMWLYPISVLFSSYLMFGSVWIMNRLRQPLVNKG